MKKYLVAASLMIVASLAFAGAGQQSQNKPKDKSVHHAAMHAENWVTHHSNPPHKKGKMKKSRKPDKSTHHAAMHAESWVTHHIKPPTKKKPDHKN